MALNKREFGRPTHCAYCGQEADTLDHFIPRALYRPRDKTKQFALPPGAGLYPPPKHLNKVACCTPCNIAKGNLHPSQWLNRCPEFGKEFVKARMQALEQWDRLAPGKNQKAS